MQVQRISPDVLKTIIAEAYGEGPEGMRAVAEVIRNRAIERGMTPEQVVQEKGQFSGYSKPGKGVAKLLDDPNVLAEAQAAWDNSASMEDPTQGAQYFYSGSRAPTAGSALQVVYEVGNHRFLAPADSPIVQEAAKAPPGTVPTAVTRAAAELAKAGVIPPLDDRKLDANLPNAAQAELARLGPRPDLSESDRRIEDYFETERAKARTAQPPRDVAPGRAPTGALPADDAPPLARLPNVPPAGGIGYLQGAVPDYGTPGFDESDRLIEDYRETERAKAFSAMPARANPPPYDPLSSINPPVNVDQGFAGRFPPETPRPSFTMQDIFDATSFIDPSRYGPQSASTSAQQAVEGQATGAPIQDARLPRARPETVPRTVAAPGNGVEYGLQNDTMQGMQPEALSMLNAAADAGRKAGLSSIRVLGAMDVDEPGHLSHYAGTELDITGVNPDGSPWTPEQRVQVASAAATVGGNRFGFYTGSRKSLHMGIGAGDMPRDVAWGPNGQLNGVPLSAFHPAEQGFVEALRSGQIGQYVNAGPEQVAALQQALNENGANLDVDGVFGGDTAKALADTQNAGRIRATLGDTTYGLHSQANDYLITDSQPPPMMDQAAAAAAAYEALPKASPVSDEQIAKLDRQDALSDMKGESAPELAAPLDQAAVTPPSASAAPPPIKMAEPSPTSEKPPAAEEAPPELAAPRQVPTTTIGTNSSEPPDLAGVQAEPTTPMPVQTESFSGLQQSDPYAPAPGVLTPPPAAYDPLSSIQAPAPPPVAEAPPELAAPAPVTPPIAQPRSRVEQVVEDAPPLAAPPHAVEPAPQPEQSGIFDRLSGMVQSAQDAIQQAPGQIRDYVVGQIKDQMFSDPIDRARRSATDPDGFFDSDRFWSQLDDDPSMENQTRQTQAARVAAQGAAANRSLASSRDGGGTRSGMMGGGYRSYGSNYRDSITPGSGSYDRGKALTDRTGNM